EQRGEADRPRSHHHASHSGFDARSIDAVKSYRERLHQSSLARGNFLRQFEDTSFCARDVLTEPARLLPQSQDLAFVTMETLATPARLAFSTRHPGQRCDALADLESAHPTAD